MKNYIYDQNSSQVEGHFSFFRKKIVERLENVYLNKFPETRNNSKFYFLNINFFDRYALFYSVFIMFLPKQNCHIFLHSCRARGLFLKMLSVFFKKIKIYVFSKHLKNLLVMHNFEERNVILTEFPNVNLSSKRTFRKINSSGLKKTCVIWGKSSQNLPLSLLQTLEANSIQISFIKNSKEKINEYKSNMIQYFTKPTEEDLHEIISQSSFGLIYLCGPNEKYYNYSMNASGIFLTNRKYSIPSLVILNSNHYDEEIHEDGISMRLSENEDFNEKLSLFLQKLKLGTYKNVKYKNLNTIL